MYAAAGAGKGGNMKGKEHFQKIHEENCIRQTRQVKMVTV